MNSIYYIRVLYRYILLSVRTVQIEPQNVYKNQQSTRTIVYIYNTLYYNNIQLQIVNIITILYCYNV